METIFIYVLYSFESQKYNDKTCDFYSQLIHNETRNLNSDIYYFILTTNS